MTRRLTLCSLCVLLVGAALVLVLVVGPGSGNEASKPSGGAVQNRTAPPGARDDPSPVSSLPAAAAPPPPPSTQVEAREFPTPSEPSPSPDGVAGLPQTPAGQALGEYFAAMAGVGPDAEARYQERLRELRRHAAEAAKLARDVYQATPKGEYYGRQAAVEALSALESHEAAGALAEIAREPIPPGLADSHDDHRLISEGTIRFSAIRGLGEIAGAGNEQASLSLREVATGGHPTVQLYAAQVYVEAHGYSREARRETAALLPAEDRLLLEARPTDAADLPRLDPDLRKPIEPGKRGAKTSNPPVEGE